MTARRGLRALGPLVIGIPLVLSAVYVMVYLYRWEWNRALISGVFFLAAEVALIGSVVLARLGRLERQLEQTGAAASPAAPDVDVARESPFAWLDPADGRLGVFVPLLLGAGVLFSAIAFVIERLSGAVAHGRAASGPTGPGRLLPAGLLAFVPTDRLWERKSAHGAERRAQTSRGLAPFAVIAAAGALLVPAVGRLADATQTRPDRTPDLTTMEVDVRLRDPRISAVDEALALWISCQRKGSFDPVRIEPTGPGTARLSVRGLLGTYQRRELTGCLQDTRLERVQARVVTLTTAPPPPPGQA